MTAKDKAKKIYNDHFLIGHEYTISNALISVNREIKFAKRRGDLSNVAEWEEIRFELKQL